MRVAQAALAGAIAVGGLVAAGSAAGADPKSGELITLECDGGTFQVVAKGNGEFTPAHDLNSNTVFIPTAFGEFSFQVFDPSGTLVDEGTETETTSKGQSAKNKDTIDCTFFVDEVDEDGFRFVASGEVTGFAAPPDR